MEVEMEKGKLYERQQEMISFIGSFSHNKGYPPTIRQIGEAVSISSTSVVNYNLNKLERDGYILRDLKVSRGVRLVEGIGRRGSRKSDNLSIPLAGFIFPSAPVLIGDTPQTATDEVIQLTRDLISDQSEMF